MGRYDHYHRQQARKALELIPAGVPCFANLGRRHPDYGMSPTEHTASKAIREAKLGRSRKGMPRRVYKTDLVKALG